MPLICVAGRTPRQTRPLVKYISAHAHLVEMRTLGQARGVEWKLALVIETGLVDVVAGLDVDLGGPDREVA